MNTYEFASCIDRFLYDYSDSSYIGRKNRGSYAQINVKDKYSFIVEKEGKIGTHGDLSFMVNSGRTPNYYYGKEGMNLRSGKKLNCISNTNISYELEYLIKYWSSEDVTRCLVVKTFIPLLTKYHTVMMNEYTLHKLYDTSLKKIISLIDAIESSVPAVYKNVMCRKTEMGLCVSREDSRVNRDMRSYSFCKCHYGVVPARSINATIKSGHHQDEYLPILKELKELYSQPHRNLLRRRECEKVVANKLPVDCTSVVFTFISKY